MFSVAEETEVTVNWMLVVARAGNEMVVAPEFARLPTETVLPSEKVSVPPKTWSLAFGRSYSTTLSARMEVGHVSFTQLAAFPPTVAHSFVESSGQPR